MKHAIALLPALLFLGSCGNPAADTKKQDEPSADTSYLSQPLIRDLYTADPSAHVFEGRLYIYPSHDIDAGIPENDLGDHFAMRDYHVFSMDSVGGKITDHGVALDLKNIPWAKRQLWAPDAAYKNGRYYLYFPAKDSTGAFRIGVATSTSPAGPFTPEKEPIPGSYSIDPAVFTDEDGQTYLYFGGIWGGQLQMWHDGKFDPNGSKTDSLHDSLPAISCRVAKLNKDMLHFDGPVQAARILDSTGRPLTGKDHDKRFFEGAWMHKYQQLYYLTYSTGDTHYLAYATSTSPWGPFTYRGIFMKPVQGWTTHHSTVEHKGKWYIFYHDTQLSGKTHLRNIKVTELKHGADGSIALIDPFAKK